jgi:hypothetical protein
MKRVIVLTSFAPAFAAVLPSSAEAQPAPERGEVELIRYSASGTGCPGGVSGALLTADLRSLVVILPDAFNVKTGAEPSRRSRFCAVSFDLGVPEGWSFALTQVAHQGFADLEVGMRAQQTSTYWFLGSARQGVFSSTIQGPFWGSFYKNETLSAGAAAWSACGDDRPLKLDIDLSVTGGGSSDEGSVSGAGRVLFYHLSWRQCG